MPEGIYEVIALGARYWFAFLGVVIVWRAFRWLRKDRSAKHRRLRRLPDAGYVGELVVLLGSDELPEGSAIPVPWEGVMGYLRTCDVVVPVPGVAHQHLDFSFRRGKGLLVRPLRGCDCIVDGVTLEHRSPSAKHPLHHGSRLQLGDAILRLCLFAGLETDRRATLQPDASCRPLPFSGEEWPQQEWPEDPGAYQPQGWPEEPGAYQPQAWPEEPGAYQPQDWREEPGAYQPQGWPEEPGAYRPQPWQTPPQPPVSQQTPYQQEPSWTRGGATDPYVRRSRSARRYDDG